MLYAAWRLFATRKTRWQPDTLIDAIKIRPHSREALYNLGMFYQESGQYSRAVDTYEVLGKMDTLSGCALIQRDISTSFTCGFRKGGCDFTKAIARDPQYAESWV